MAIKNKIAKSILQTLCYSDIFNYPLTKQELYERCITSEKITPSKFVSELSRLTDGGFIKKTSSYYHLPHRSNTVGLRLRHTKYSQVKIQKAKQVAAGILQLPYIEAVFLTGTVAVNNASLHDDIDIMIVTTPNSLWTARFLVTLWLEWHRLRRRPNQKQTANLICANLYVSSDDVQVLESQRNLYTAHEVIQLKPLADPHFWHEKFMAVNDWVKAYMANLPVVEHSVVSVSTSKESAPRWLERIAYKFQLWYMTKRRTREHISASHAYFHPKDLATTLLALYNMRVENYDKKI